VAPALEAPGAEDYVPMFSKETAIDRIRTASTLADLTKFYDEILADFDASKREMPVEIAEAFDDRKASL